MCQKELRNTLYFMGYFHLFINCIVMKILKCNILQQSIPVFILFTKQHKNHNNYRICYRKRKMLHNWGYLMDQSNVTKIILIFFFKILHFLVFQA